MKSKNQTLPLLTSVKFYALVAFTAFSPCLLSGQAYFDNDLLAQFGPWRAFLKDQLAQGHFPLWNPYLMGGEPFFANLQNMMLYPINYLTLPFSVPYGLSLFFFIHFFGGALGTHLWLRSLSLSERSSRVGALLFAFSGFFWLEIIHPPVLAAFAWLPWLMLSLEALSREPGAKNGFFAGLTFALLFLCGSFQVTLGALYGGLAYFLFRVWGASLIRLLTGAKAPKLKRKKTNSFWPAFLFLLWGSLPLWGQMIPTLEFSALTDRRVTPLTADQFNPALSLDPAILYQFLFPRFTLPKDQTMAEAIQGHEGNENTGSRFSANLGYLGIWVPFFAFFAFRKKDKALPLFFSLGSLAILPVCFGKYLPVHEFLCALVPGLSLILVPFRFLYLYILGMVVLASFGFEEWTASPVKNKNWIASLRGPLLYAIPLLLISLARPAQNWREISALLLGLAGIFLYRLMPALKTRGLQILQAALILPLLLSGWSDFAPGPASNFDYENNSKTIPHMNQWVSPYRFIFDTLNLKYPIQVHGQKYLVNYPQNASCALQMKNFGGYNPLILQTKKDIASVGLEPLIHLGAIKGILTQGDLGEIPGLKKESFPPYVFYEYQGPLAWAYAPNEAHVVPDSQMRLAILRKPDYDISRQMIFSEPPPVGQKPSEGLPPAGLECKMEKDEAESQTFTLDLGRDNWVVFSEIMFPGWKAYVDGKPAGMMTADHFLRALYLKAGNHRVDFRYEPFWLTPLQIGSVLWVLLTLGFWFKPRGFARKWLHA